MREATDLASPASKLLAIVLHDVAPATWASCQRLSTMIAELDSSAPLSLLLVPRFHHGVSMTDHPSWRDWIEARVAHGDELALHGWSHLDEAVPPRTPASWFARRVMTDGEGEFAALSAAEAKQRIELGLECFRRCGWSARGFVPPAWQISAAAREALGEFPFTYTSTLNTLEQLPEGRSWRVPYLGFSSRSAIRRWASIHWNRRRLASVRHARFLRLALHPIDADYDETLNAWRELLSALLQERRAVTKEALVQSLAVADEWTAIASL